jgi:hypothetical protein
MTNYNKIETFKYRVLGPGQISKEDLEILTLIENANKKSEQKGETNAK